MQWPPRQAHHAAPNPTACRSNPPPNKIWTPAKLEMAAVRAASQPSSPVLKFLPGPLRPAYPRLRLRQRLASQICAEETLLEGEVGRGKALDAVSTLASAAAAGSAGPTEDETLLLDVRGLSARVAATRGHLTLKGGVRTDESSTGGQQQQQILHGVTLAIRQGEVRSTSAQQPARYHSGLDAAVLLQHIMLACSLFLVMRHG